MYVYTLLHKTYVRTFFPGEKMAFPLLPPSFSFLFLPPPPFPISSSMTHPSTRPTSSPFPSFLFPNLRDQKTSASVREERVGGAFSSAASLPPRPRGRVKVLGVSFSLSLSSSCLFGRFHLPLLSPLVGGGDVFISFLLFGKASAVGYREESRRGRREGPLILLFLFLL